MRVPKQRGPVSGWVSAVMHGQNGPFPALAAGSVITDADVQLALWMIYELHYRGFDDIPEDVEWVLSLIQLRRDIEVRFEAELRGATAPLPTVEDDLGQQVLDIADADRGPSLALFLQREADAGQMCDYLRERSITQLKESDPQSFVLGRLEGSAKVALAELQYDEYGGGRPDRLHAQLYAQALQAAGLDPTYGAYIDQVSAVTLATANVMSMFAMNRRFRGASMGHLAVFEATSSVPCRRIATGLGRLGFPADVAVYFEEHIEADAVHEQLAARDICAPMAADQPHLGPDILFGAATCLYLEGLAAADLLARWHAEERVAS